MPSSFPTEMLTIEEFASRMKIGRTTAFQWIKDGTLVQGHHYLKIDRVLRILWGPNLITHLAEDTRDAEEKELRARGQRTQITPRAKSAIDLSYR